jgi:hypothetical protein
MRNIQILILRKLFFFTRKLTGTKPSFSAYGDLLPASVETYGGEDLTSLELSHYEKSETKLATTDVVATPLAMIPTSTEDPQTKLPNTGNDETASETSSTVIVDSKNGSADKDTDDKKAAQLVSAAAIGPGASNDPGSESQKKEDKGGPDDKKDVKDEGDKGKGDEGKKEKKEDKEDKGDNDEKDEKDEKDSNDVKDSLQPKGPDAVMHEGFGCNECKVRRNTFPHIPPTNIGT